MAAGLISGSRDVWARESRSEVQLNDVRNLLKTVGDLGGSYIKEWVRRLDLGEVFKECEG